MRLGYLPALLLLSSTALAQRIDTTFVSDTVTVRAERSFSAASEARLRAADLTLRPRSSTQDVLRIVPGLVIAQHAGGGKAEQIFLRGFDCDHGTDINITVDDAPVNMISHGHGQGYADLHFVIPETIKRVDVVKGPYFARYGDLATAGAVSFVTADSIESNLVKLEADPFTQKSVRGVALLNVPIDGAASAYVGGEIYRSDGYFELPQDFTRGNLFAKLVAPIDKQRSITASISGFKASWDASGQIPERAVASGQISRYGSIDPTEGGLTSRSTATVRYRSTGDAPLTITASATDYRFQLFSNFTLYARDSVRGDGIEQTDDRTILSLRFEQDHFYDFLDLLMRTRVGATLRSDDIDASLHHDSARLRLETVSDASIGEQQVGPYIEQEIVLPWMQLLLGARADWVRFDVTNNRQPGTAPSGVARQLLVSPKANISIPLSDRSAIYANSGFGFHSNDARVAVTSPSSTLPRAFGAEIGARTGGDWFEASAALWLLDLESELVYVGDEGTTEESGRTRRSGVDIELLMTPLSWLSLGVDATISRGRFRDLPDGEDHIPLAPEVTLSANAVARLGEFSGALRLRAVGDRPANESNSVRAHGYAIVDLSASYRVGSLEFFANVENLLDAEWNEAQFDTESRLKGEAVAVSELHFTPGTPRAVRGGVAYRF